MLPIKTVLLGTWHGLVDGLRMLLGLRPHLVPIVGLPGTLAAMTSEESYPGYTALIPKDSTWRNAMPARIFLTVTAYNPMARARRIKSPTLLVGARYDSLVPIKAVRKTARRIANCRFVELECNHFEPYVGEWFERNVSVETEFLRETLLPK
jgi:pimeloyl-ACP methyl ester carboxylesterase